MNSKECEKLGCLACCKWYKNGKCNHPDRKSAGVLSPTLFDLMEMEVEA